MKRRELNPIIAANTGDHLRCSVCVSNRQERSNRCFEKENEYLISAFFDPGKWANRREKRKGLSPPFPLSVKAEGSLVLKRKANDGCKLSVIFGKKSDYNEGSVTNFLRVLVRK